MTTESAGPQDTHRPVQHVRDHGSDWDGGCLVCDECDLDVAHKEPCDCDCQEVPLDGI
jgi:hypothetical protein